MLMLTRNQGEAITITHPDGTEIVVLVIASEGQVRLGIDAPSDVRILRDNAKNRERMA